MEQQTLYICIIMHLGTHVPQLRSPAPQQLAPLISISGTKETRSDYTEERKKIPEIWIIILNFLKYFNFTLMCFPREKCAPLPTLLLIHLLPLCLPLLLIHLHPPPPPPSFPWNIWKKIPNLYFQLFLKVWNFNYSNQLRDSLPLSPLPHAVVYNKRCYFGILFWIATWALLNYF